MRIAYFDCSSGISGDMILGALVDAGVDMAEIQAGIDSLGLPHCRLSSREVKRHGFRATKVDVQHAEEHAHRHLYHITQMIEASSLTEKQKELATRIFTRLGEAEAHVHGTTLDKVHFHEVGAVDSIADIVGSAIGLDRLGLGRIESSPIAVGSGTIQIAHGRVGLPAPATAELLKGIPLVGSDVQAELATPTGSAILATVVDHFGPLPAMRTEKIAYGAGSRDLQQQPNVVRLMLGQSSESVLSDQVWILETNLDDVSPEVIGHCSALLAEAGALDVSTTTIQMKKNRPGVKLTVLCSSEQAERMEAILFRETSTLGVRRWIAGRHTLVREPYTVKTRWGPVRGKLAVRPDGTRSFSPEYETCRRVALEHDAALHEVYDAARRAFDDRS